MTDIETIFLEHVKTHDSKMSTDGVTRYYDMTSRIIAISGKYNYRKIIKYDDFGNKILIHDSDGNWEKRKYEKKKIIEFISSNGTYWKKK